MIRESSRYLPGASVLDTVETEDERMLLDMFPDCDGSRSSLHLGTSLDTGQSDALTMRIRSVFGSRSLLS